MRRASVKRSNCYMVWGGDATGAAHASSRSNVDLEIGCLIDLATGLVTFTINGKETSSSYQVGGSEAPVGSAGSPLDLETDKLRLLASAWRILFKKKNCLILLFSPFTDTR